jgi:hypothetical protein
VARDPTRSSEDYAPRAFVVPGTEPVVTHLVAADSEYGGDENDDDGQS